MNPFYNNSNDTKHQKKNLDDSESDYSDSDSNIQDSTKNSASEKTSKNNQNNNPVNSPTKEKKQNKSSNELNDSKTDATTHSKKKKDKKSSHSKKASPISTQQFSKILGPLFENNTTLIRKVTKVFEQYSDDTIDETTVISKLIKICGQDSTKLILNQLDDLLSNEKQITSLQQASSSYDCITTDILEGLKTKTIKSKDKQITVEKLVTTYTDARKTGSKLKKQATVILKKLNKKSIEYKKIRLCKKTLSQIQEECDECIDEEDMDENTLCELVSKYTACLNEITKLLDSSLDIEESSESDSDSDDDDDDNNDDKHLKKKKKVHMPVFDDEDEDDSPDQKLLIQNRKAVYNTIIKDQNGTLSTSHVILEPHVQISLPLRVKKGDVIGFGWKERYDSRLLFRCTLSPSDEEIDDFDIVPLQIRISEYHMIYQITEAGVLRFTWDNGLSVRKSKDIDIFIKYFYPECAEAVLEAETKRLEAWRQEAKRHLIGGNMEGGYLTLQLTERVQTEDGVKYTCCCDWESIQFPIQTTWTVQYPYLQWIEWYNTLLTKYPSRVKRMPSFERIAFVTTKAVVIERLKKMNSFFQILVQDAFLMETPEVVSWFHCQEYIRIAKHILCLYIFMSFLIVRQYTEKCEKEKAKQEKKKQHLSDEVAQLAQLAQLDKRDKRDKQDKQDKTKDEQSKEDLFDPLSYLCE